MKAALLAIALFFTASTAFAHNCPASPDSTWLVPYWNGTYYWAGYNNGSGIGKAGATYTGTVVLGEYYGYACALAQRNDGSGSWDFFYLTSGDNGGGSPNYIQGGLTGWYEQSCFNDDAQYVTVLDSDTTLNVHTNGAGYITFNKFDYGTVGTDLLVYLNGGNDTFDYLGSDSAAINYVDGGPGDDLLHVIGGSNYLYGRAGFDHIQATQADYVDGGDDDDCISVYSTPSITCGAGFNDIVHYNSANGTPSIDSTCEVLDNNYPNAGVNSCL